MQPSGVRQDWEGPCFWSGAGLEWPLTRPRTPVAGVNLLVGTENGLMLLDRSGQGKVYGLIGRRRFQQMDVLEGLNLLITISGACVEFGDKGLNSTLLSSAQEDSHGHSLWCADTTMGSSNQVFDKNASMSMYVHLSISQGKGTNCGYITCPGFGTRFCTMTQRWRRSKGGPPWGTWRAVATTVSVRMPQHSSQRDTRSGISTARSSKADNGSHCMPPSFSPPVKYERIKFLVIALKNSVEVYAWAPKPYHKFMAFKVIPL